MYVRMRVLARVCMRMCVAITARVHVCVHAHSAPVCACDVRVCAHTRAGVCACAGLPTARRRWKEANGETLAVPVPAEYISPPLAHNYLKISNKIKIKKNI